MMHFWIACILLKFGLIKQNFATENAPYIFCYREKKEDLQLFLKVFSHHAQKIYIFIVYCYHIMFQYDDWKMTFFNQTGQQLLC